jgi:hypothetical protein
MAGICIPDGSNGTVAGDTSEMKGLMLVDSGKDVSTVH